MIGLILSIVATIVVGGYVFITWNHNHWKKRNFPGPEPRFFLGNIPSMVTQKRNMTYDVDDLYREFKDRHGIIGFFSMRSPSLMILQPDVAKDVLVKNFKHFSTNQFTDMMDKETDPIFARNPFMLRGDEWKEKRAEITPAFTSTRIKTMYPIIDDVCAIMIKYLERECEKAPVDGIDAKELAAMYTTDVVSNCIFGLDAGSFTGGDATIRKMGKKLMEPNWQIMLYFMAVQMLPFLMKIYKMAFVPKYIEKFFVQIMKNAIAFREKSNVDRFDYLHYLLELKEKKNLNELDMVAHAVTFFLDGFETSSIAMAFTLYELAGHKNAQNKLRKEIQDTIASHGKLTFDIVSEMPYLDQVLNESLRLYPPATTSAKVCTERIQFKVKEGEYRTIEKDDNIAIPIYCFHRDPEFYENPNEFIPERFDQENGGVKAFREKGVFLPFSDGPRICLGQRFAQTQLKAAIVSLIRDFEIDVNPKTKEPIVLDPKQFLAYAEGGLWLNFKKL
ncbi:probable cytochrome P450 28a5 [Phlebotomus argentipes]|uniref:probable cytochrome P450 28a5 n=1 Tax=Phlebotomus argentipes TaxID=94469 RepID=UPI0028929ED1|nr:probable cytochrome P450 28a5 [Phlebotomus argentipes]